MRKPLSTKKMSTPSDPPFGNNDPKNGFGWTRSTSTRCVTLCGAPTGQPGERHGRRT